MNPEPIQIDYEAVDGAAGMFDTSSTTLKAVSQALGLAIEILEAKAMLGDIGSAVMAQYLSGIKPNVDRLGETCSEMATDLRGVVATYQQANTSISTKFVRFG